MDIEKLVSRPTDSLSNLMKLHQGRHSTFQIDNFIIGKSSGTPYGRLKQCLRELNARNGGLRTQYRERERIAEEIALEKNARLKAGLCDQLTDLNRDVGEQEREWSRFYALAKHYHGIVGDVDARGAEELEAEMWFDTVKRRVGLELAVRGGITEQTFEMLHMMPKDLVAPIVDELEKKDGSGRMALIGWYKSQPDMIDPKQLEM